MIGLIMAGGKGTRMNLNHEKLLLKYKKPIILHVVDSLKNSNCFSKILAKFSMVLLASLGNSASLGSNSPFIKTMKDKKKLMAAFLIMIIPITLLGETTGLVMLGVTIIVTLFILAISTRSFGGITGDVLGSTNELTRLASLMVFISI